MNRRPALYASAPLILSMLALSGWAWPQIPQDAQIAVHWNLSGSPNGFLSKVTGLFVVPLMAIALTLVLVALPQIEPRRSNLWQSAKAYNAVWVAIVAFLAVVHTSLVLNAVGHHVNQSVLAVTLVGVLFIVMGNYLGKVRSNFFFGIRTPWTLSSERSWDRTHRLGGRLFVVLGLALLPTAWTGYVGLSVGLMLAGMGLIVVVTVAYSYLTWRADPAKQAVGRQSFV